MSQSILQPEGRHSRNAPINLLAGGKALQKCPNQSFSRREGTLEMSQSISQSFLCFWNLTPALTQKGLGMNACVYRTRHLYWHIFVLFRQKAFILNPLHTLIFFLSPERLQSERKERERETGTDRERERRVTYEWQVRRLNRIAVFFSI